MPGLVHAASAADVAPGAHLGRSLQVVSLFSGIEAASASLDAIGSAYRMLAFSEIDPAACAVLQHRFPEVPNVGDVRAFDFAGLHGQCDILAGGPPCIAFSVSGKRLGKADPRGALADHYFRVVGELLPRWFLLENVPGLLTSDNGRDFASLLLQVRELGYSCAYRILDAQFFGTPQQRRRLFVVGFRGNWRAPASVLFEPESQGRPAATERGQGARPAAAGRAAGQPGRRAPEQDAHVHAVDFRHGRVTGETTTTLCAKNTGGWSLNYQPGVIQPSPIPGHCHLVRRITPGEALRLQGFPADWLDGVHVGGRPLSYGETMRLVGNSWPVPVTAWILRRILWIDQWSGKLEA